MKNKVIAWDLGTSGNKASLYDIYGNCLAEETVSYKTYYTQDGGHEQDPREWWDAVIKSTRLLLSKTAIDTSDILCCGISGHSMCCVPLGVSGELLAERVPIWSDTRAVAQSLAFFEKFGRDRWYTLTGAGTKPGGYPVFKVCWYRDNRPDIFSRLHVVLGTTDYVNYLLTGELTTSRSNACGSGAYDLMREDFSDEILEGNGLSRDIFPRIVLETDVIGRIQPAAAEALGLPCDVLVTAGGTDNICMAVGGKCFTSGRAYIALGSSCWIAWTGEKPVLDINSYPYVFPLCGKLFNSALSLASGGSAYKWAKEQLCGDLDIAAEKQCRNAYELMEELILLSPVGGNGLLFNSCLGGGMPFDPGPNMRGGYLGLQLKHTKADMLRATLEGITFKLRECIEHLEKIAKIDNEVLLVGGGSKTAVWRQIIADCFNKTVLKSNIDEQAAALGAAAFALVGTGIWSDYSNIDSLHVIESLTAPIAENTRVYNELFPIYLKGSEYLSTLGDELMALQAKKR